MNPPQPLSVSAIHYPDLSQHLREYSLKFLTTLIGLLLILNKNLILARILRANLSSMPHTSVFKMPTKQTFQDCKERCD